MKNYFLKYCSSYGNIKAEVDLSNYVKVNLCKHNRY